MHTRTLGTTDLSVSTITFGCWGIIGGWNWGPQDKQDSLEALRTAYDHGITLFDTAEGYGDGGSERLLAEALGDVRDSILIATKVSPSHFAPDELHAACERSLRNLKTDRIDLYQLHWPNRNIPIAETIGVLDELKQQGKIRHYGVSNFGKHDLAEVLDAGAAPVSDQLVYSLLFRALEFEILPYCARHDVSVLTYSSLMQGLLAGKYHSADDVREDRARTRHFAGSRPHTRHSENGVEELTFETVRRIGGIAEQSDVVMAEMSLAWLLAQPGVTSVIAGARTAGQARSIARAGGMTLAPSTLAALDKATRPLKDALGRNADMWQSESRIQ